MESGRVLARLSIQPQDSDWLSTKARKGRLQSFHDQVSRQIHRTYLAAGSATSHWLPCVHIFLQHLRFPPFSRFQGFIHPVSINTELECAKFPTGIELLTLPVEF